MSDDRIMARIRDLHPELTAIRRDIHAHPELGMEETRTAALVADRLREWGIPFVAGVGNTGIVATLKGRRPGQRAIGLRADMDALSILEQTGAAHASRNEGVMHACGHDGHTTMLLGAARALAADPDFGGTVHFIFQPAEEGRGGAKAMLADGLFERFPCDVVYGMHNMPGIPVGRFALRKGPMLAASGRWDVVFRGNGGHGGASPHLASDLSIVLAHFVLALQGIVGRNIPALEPAVISVGHVAGGSAISPNVMPAEMTVAGTARCYSKATQQVIERRMAELARSLAESHGATAEVTLHWGVPATVNHEEQTDVAIAAASAVAGAANVEGNMTPSTGGEDFAEMLEARPGAIIFIGNGVGADGSYHAVHTPHYDFNDEIIPLGVRYWVSLVEQELAMGAEAG
jgi:amidohydrolase